MRPEQSLKEIANMSPNRRLRLARKKLSFLNEGLVPALVNHVEVHENTRWLLYKPDLVDQIERSFAANAFASLQNSFLFFEIIRLCTFWDPVDLDGRSVPTIAALVDCREVSRLVYEDHLSHYDEASAEFALRYAQKARRKLREGVRKAKQIERSEILRHSRNFRDRLAHQVEQTREEKRNPVSPPRAGDERKLLNSTISTVNLLYLSINGTNFAWSEMRRKRKQNAEALWKGVKINVLR